MSGTEVAVILIGIVTTAAMGLAGWALAKINQLERDLAAANATALALEKEVNRRFEDSRSDTKDAIQQFRDMANKLENKIDDIGEKFEEGLDTVHRRLDQLHTPPASASGT